ncbi:Hemerythrin domain-containing protein OS=Castellaniella defragrans OX=75697 GN=HNR28_000288 PE=4 SV=1 [Castellaniella defragrans]
MTHADFTDVDFTDPVFVLLGLDALARTHLRVLGAGAADPARGVAVPGRGPEGPTHSALQAAAAWLEGPGQTQRRLLEEQVFPALVESMAGSDAVCLRDLAESLTRERNELDRRWRATIHPQLVLGISSGTDTQAWVVAFEAYLRRVDEELLPMVPRLFDDEALDALAQACAHALQATGLRPS